MNCIISIPQEAYDLIMGKTDAANLDLYSTLIQSVKNGIQLDTLRDRIACEKLGYPPSADQYKTINRVLQIIDNPWRLKLQTEEDKE